MASSFHRRREQSGEELPESERPSHAEIANDGLVAIVAGSDTTGSVLTAMVYYLLRNPVVYERLQVEVDGAFPTGEEPLDVTKLNQMEWMNGCMWVCGMLVRNLRELIFATANSNEALRLQPAVPSGSQRTVGKGKGQKVLGKL